MVSVPNSRYKGYTTQMHGGKIEFNEIFKKVKPFLLPAAAGAAAFLGGRFLANRNQNKDISNVMSDPNQMNMMGNFQQQGQQMMGNFQQQGQQMYNQGRSFLGGIKNQLIEQGRNAVQSRFSSLQDELQNKIEVQKERLREMASQYEPEKLIKKHKDKLTELKIKAIDEGKKLRQKAAFKSEILKSMAKLNNDIEDEKEEAIQETLMEGEGVSKKQRRMLKKLIKGSGMLKY